MTRSLALAIPLKLAAAATAALFAALLAASPGAHSQSQPVLTGTAAWDGPAVLPESAEFEATVLDVTPTGRAPELIGRTRVRQIQAKPVRFAIPYDPALVKPGHSYRIEARIADRGNLLYATAAPVPVLVDGAPTPVALTLPVRSGLAAAPQPVGNASGRSPVTGTPWITGKGVASPPQPPLIATSRAGTGPGPGALLPMPATYAGTLPCADCSGIHYTLTLESGGPYRLTQEYLGKPGEPSFRTVGQWRFDAATRTLTLDENPTRPVAFQVTDTGNLRLLDVSGRPIVSDMNYELAPTGSAVSGSMPGRAATAPPPYNPTPYNPAPAASAPIAPPIIPAQPPTNYGAGATGNPMALSAPGSNPTRRLRGLYRGSTDGASFAECGDSRAIAVAPAGQDALLANAYQRAQPRPGEAMLVEVDGRIGFGPRPAGGGLGRTLTVERFVAIHPGETCSPAPANAAAATPGQAWTTPDGRPPLRDTTWRLLSVSQQTVAPAPGQPGPYLEMNRDLPVFSGNSGCNGLGGEYVLVDQSLYFTLGPSTQMACPGTMELERAFRDGLAKTAAWSITGDHLTLYGADGTALLRFSARRF